MLLLGFIFKFLKKSLNRFKTTMRTIRKKASIIELEYTPKFGWFNKNIHSLPPNDERTMSER